jgi:hypothetical protein
MEFSLWPEWATHGMDQHRQAPGPGRPSKRGQGCNFRTSASRLLETLPFALVALYLNRQLDQQICTVCHTHPDLRRPSGFASPRSVTSERPGAVYDLSVARYRPRARRKCDRQVPRAEIHRHCWPLLKTRLPLLKISSGTSHQLC